jgi:hypothetical protein
MKLIHTYSGGEHRESFWMPDREELARLAAGAAVRTRHDTLTLLVDVLDVETLADDDDGGDDDDDMPSAAELGAFG